ncbi:hypothetical protein Val02_72490 [Virgisporangium aliadipatigenens]|uniref:Ketosynthase family 3 (KS3) domain-containing protein n=1 Tax=Virgisporangium aliadipatigenens TaxID=741659 RepID=A0A8J3YVA0_9ACTN|nr:polyketide synthase [Virgisporangium aliadipatigenens]GIJ50363.1 hypothetical protein Val02_72490 [Virgisporangium aliadipatigenens]
MGEDERMGGSGRSAGEPIAVIGMGVRLPGAHGGQQLWQLLLAGRDAVGEVPASRFVADTVHAGGRGGFLDDVAGFDADFFGIAADEADAMDPQQRLLLMTAWEAVEDAGLLPERLAGSRTGVFVALGHSDYWDLYGPDPSTVDLAVLAGSAQRGMAAGRLSYALDLHGPSLLVDGAQASSGVAVHLAVRSLRCGDSSTAIVGAANLVLAPAGAIAFGRAGVLAADGRCKFADASADGFVRSDGVVCVVLKPLAAALADGDPVRAVLCGTAVAQDGRDKPGMFAPSVRGQVRAMRWAYADAGLEPSTVDYVEAHGTGTGIDAVELAALREVLAPGRAGRPCLVGSLKSNIGHPEAAAGLAGLAKAVLCLENGLVPVSLHHTRPRTDVDWTAVPLVVPTTPTPLPDTGRPAVVAVNGQGMTGTDVHLVLTAAPPTASPRDDGARRTLLLSARSPHGLRALARSWADFLASDAARSLTPRDICHTANHHRIPHAHRAHVVARTHDEFAVRLRDIAAGHTTAPTVPPPPTPEPGARPVSLPPRPWHTSRHWLDAAPVSR